MSESESRISGSPSVTFFPYKTSPTYCKLTQNQSTPLSVPIMLEVNSPKANLPRYLDNLETKKKLIGLLSVLSFKN